MSDYDYAQRIASLEREVFRLKETLERVRALHVPYGIPKFCGECAQDDHGDWPCPTIQALECPVSR